MPDWGSNLMVFLAVFFGMEGVAWATHRYVMHGSLWILHESHHRPRSSWFELNDLFGFFFSFVSFGLILARNVLLWAAALGRTGHGRIWAGLFPGA